ncbi:DUF6879 family protein [Streptacidiphilus cavernicola]|uniref:DUF6879 family protein n=1 Tax=Streptacidiphilus cavernicola TaxID=3342716 RepID=A0ABV6VRK1_9ACTN
MSQKDWTEPFRQARYSAVHLEMRDSYAVAAEAERFAAWRETGTVDVEADAVEHRQVWMALVREMVARGVIVRRARIISEPVTDYIRWEHAITAANLGAGEQVSWLPRRSAADLALPGTDFWLFDDDLVRFGHFTGDGDLAGHEVRTESHVLKLCRESFDQVWDRATPHEDYEIH